MNPFISPEIQQRLSDLMNGKGKHVDRTVDESAYRANLRGITRINAAHKACLKAYKYLNDDPVLLTKLIPPVTNQDYILLVLENTHFKRVSTQQTITAYFLSKDSISLRSCMSEKITYATLHKARKRVNQTHKMFVRAFNILNKIKGNPIE